MRREATAENPPGSAVPPTHSQRPFRLQVVVSATPQLFVDQGHEGAKGALVALFPVKQKRGDLARVIFRHVPGFP
jgi:hypothetical protein